jgi:hypothetical protein
MQVWPQFVNFPHNNLVAALSKLVVSSTTTGHFPPSSRTQGTRFLAAAEATAFPVIVDPVNNILSKCKFVSFIAT